MLLSLALILIIGFALSGIFNKLKLPGLIGMLITGILLGPYVLNLISPQILNISPDLRKIALIIILVRAGLNLDIDDLKRVGRPAFLMCFIPSTIEMLAVTFLAPLFFKIPYSEAAIMGAVVAAVSPAVTLPRMIKFIETGYGTKKSIPQLIMAGGSLDGIYVIIIFTALLGMQQGTGSTLISFLSVPLSILTGLLLGIISGYIIVWLFKNVHMRDTIKVLIILSMGFLFVTLENSIKSFFPISGLLSVIAMSCTILKKYEVLATRLTGKFSKIWVGAEMLLFVLVGAAVDLNHVAGTGIFAVALILIALVFRLCGVFLCLIKTSLTTKERLFCALSYIPKATVQAAIGAIPLSSGLASGNMILTIAVLAIIISAPMGAITMDMSYKKLLSKTN